MKLDEALWEFIVSKSEDACRPGAQDELEGLVRGIGVFGAADPRLLHKLTSGFLKDKVVEVIDELERLNEKIEGDSFDVLDVRSKLLSALIVSAFIVPLDESNVVRMIRVVQEWGGGLSKMWSVFVDLLAKSVVRSIIVEEIDRQEILRTQHVLARKGGV